MRNFDEWWNKYWLAPPQAVLQVEQWKYDFEEAYRAGQAEMRERAIGTLRRDTLRQMGITDDRCIRDLIRWIRELPLEGDDEEL